VLFVVSVCRQDGVTRRTNRREVSTVAAVAFHWPVQLSTWPRSLLKIKVTYWPDRTNTAEHIPSRFQVVAQQ